MSNGLYATDDFVTPGSLSPALIGGLLRRDLGFRGVVITDDLADPGVTALTTTPKAAVAAIRAGADLRLRLRTAVRAAGRLRRRPEGGARRQARSRPDQGSAAAQPVGQAQLRVDRVGTGRAIALAGRASRGRA